MSTRIKALRGIAALALMLPLLAACGGSATNTPVPAATSTTAAAASGATATTAMMAPTAMMTNTVMMAPTAMMTPTAMMAPTAMMTGTAMMAPTAMMTGTAGMVMTPTAMMTGTGAATTPTAVPPNSSFTGSSGAFRWRQGEDAPTLDPALMQDSVSINIAQNFYDGLTQFNPQTLAIEPAIASKWDVNADGSVYTFHLRKDATFSNGDAVKASDFVYSWNRLLANAQAPYGFVFADIKGANDVMAAAASTDTTKTKLTTASGIKAVDDYTLEVTLNGPSAYFLSQTALWSYWVVNQKVVGSDPMSSAWADAGKMNGAGTGSYTLKEWAHNDHMVMIANDKYWGDVKPSVKEIDVLVIADGSTAQLRYESNQLDSSELYTADYTRIKADATLSKELHEVPQARTVWLGFNATSTDPNNPFAASKGDSGKNLRVAVAEAIDRADLIDKALNGVGAPAYTLVPQGVPGYKAYKAYDLNLTDAKAKLAAANVQNLSLTYTTRDREDQNKVAAVIQAQLKQNLGLNVSVKSVPWTTFLTERQAHHYNFFYGSWGQDYPDPQDWLFPLASSGQPENNEGYSNPQFDQLVKTANALADPAKQAQRFDMYNQAEKMYLDNATIVPLYQFQTDFMLKPGWTGWGYNAQFTAPFRYLKKAGS